MSLTLTVTQNVTTLNLTVTQDTNVTTIQPTIIVAATTSYMLKSIYDTDGNGVVDDAEKVNGLTVETAVPSGALFTDTVYDDTAIQAEVDLNTAKATYPSTDSTKVGFISVTQAVDLDVMESDISDNTTSIGYISTALDTINGQII